MMGTDPVGPTVIFPRERRVTAGTEPAVCGGREVCQPCRVRAEQVYFYLVTCRCDEHSEVTRILGVQGLEGGWMSGHDCLELRAYMLPTD